MTPYGLTLKQKARYKFFDIISRIRHWWRDMNRRTSNPPQHLQDIGYAIAYFYAEKYKFDYKAAQDFVSMLSLHNLTMRGDVVVLHTSRPGLWIGRKGEDIQALSKHLGKKIDIEEVKFSWQDVIMPEPELPYDFFED